MMRISYQLIAVEYGGTVARRRLLPHGPHSSRGKAQRSVQRHQIHKPLHRGVGLLWTRRLHDEGLKQSRSVSCAQLTRRAQQDVANEAQALCDLREVPVAAAEHRICDISVGTSSCTQTAPQ